MTTSEPTTGEIVRALRFCTGEDSICGTACPAYLSEAGCRTTIMKNSADRLESQERELERLQKTIDRKDAVCYALTDRAEQAEAREKAAVAYITRNRYCEDCINDDMPSGQEPCASCHNNSGKPNFTYRKLPQEGEKQNG